LIEKKILSNGFIPHVKHTIFFKNKTKRLRVLRIKGGVYLIDENFMEVIVNFKIRGGVSVISIEFREVM